MPKWIMPWVPPTAPVAQEALTALDRPLMAWRDFGEFDSDDFYSDYPPREISQLEREVRKLGMRRVWRMERVWQPDAETPDAESEAHQRASRQVGGALIVPRCLDDYVMQAYRAADLGDDPVASLGARADLDEALEWAQAGICVLQQSLPWPFVDVLRYALLDNRPAHRVLYAYATLLHHRQPRKAGSWFRAMVYLDPNDNLGARFRAPGGPR
ncbi:hypothetical protein AB0B10_25275 [Micromonospora arborensis]|uniref:hypothetical protein n=1 Tax=Micromonospora arborensis TaxID=2116518 RepID=UPI0033CFC860